MRELRYRPTGAASGWLPGAHRGVGAGSGFEFRNHVPLVDAPDARRLDLHASLRDPFGGWFVRRFDERKAITVAVLADLSASMAFEGSERRLDVLADLVASLGISAWRVGDRFAFVGADERVRRDLLQPATRQRGAAPALAERLRTLELRGRNAAGLVDAQRWLPLRRSLVFLVSDFHWPADLLERVLASLALHEVVPVVLWSKAEFALGGGPGLAHAIEPEGGRRHWLWWRPALRERWAAAGAARREALAERFRAHRLAALTIEGAFDADAVTRHFAA